MSAAAPRSQPSARASVVIPSHGRAGRLRRILEPLVDDPATQEVIVVADRDERVAPAVRALGLERVRVVPADAGNENGARQVGVEAAGAEVVVLIDDDVLALPGLVSRHLAHDHRRHIVLGYMPVDPTRLTGVGRFPARVYERAYQTQTGAWEREPNRILSRFWAGNFSARRDDLIDIGLQNPDYRGMYFADYDLGLRLDHAGFTAAFDRTAQALHLYDRDVEGFIRDSRRQGAVLAGERGPVAPPSRRERIAAKGFLAGTLAAGTLRSRRAERYLARRLRLLEQRVGAHAVQTETAEASGLLSPADPGAERGSEPSA
jgi:GT2 family glycosyltransferase